MDRRDEVLKAMRLATEAIVSTYGGEVIRSRAMHYAVSDDFTIYLASMKGDPKITHISNIPSITLLILYKASPPETYMDLREFGKWSETEIHGKAEVVRDARERSYALKMLSERSPIVKLLVENGQDSVLEVIRVTPSLIKYKKVSEILEGKPPVVLEFKDELSSEGDLQLISRKLRNMYHAMRVPFLAATIPSILLGGLLAYLHSGVLDLWLLLLTMLGAVSAHLGLNLLNDYFDHRMGVDRANKEAVYPFTGGSRTLQMGLLSPAEVLLTSIILTLLSISIGIYLSIVVSPLILFVAAAGFTIIFVYHVPPIRLVDKGVGEILVGIGFGPIFTLGSYIVQTGELSLIPILGSIPLALLVTDILVVNEFPDYSGDLSTGKYTIVVRLGREVARYVSYILHFGAYVSIVALYIIGIYPVYSLAAILALPLSIYGKLNLHRHYSRPFDMIPAIVSNIIAHILVGFTLALGIVVAISPNPSIVLSLAMGIAAFTAYEVLELRRNISAFNLIKKGLKGV